MVITVAVRTTIQNALTVQHKPVTRSENGGVRKTIIVDLTSGQQPRWVARYEKLMGGGGGGGDCCECPLETITILPNVGLGRSPNSFAFFFL